jgi:hypothetical protein
VANPVRPTSTRALVLVEQLTAHGRATPLRAPKVRNRWIDVTAIGSTNVEQML